MVTTSASTSFSVANHKLFFKHPHETSSTEFSFAVLKRSPFHVHTMDSFPGYFTVAEYQQRRFNLMYAWCITDHQNNVSCRHS